MMPPPKINAEEQTLARYSRRTLAQRRANKFPLLIEYLHAHARTRLHVRAHSCSRSTLLDVAGRVGDVTLVVQLLLSDNEMRAEEENWDLGDYTCPIWSTGLLFLATW